MANYNQFKQAWDRMDDNQRKQAVEQYKDNDQFKQFADQYHQEKNNSGSNGGMNQNSSTDFNQWTNTQQGVDDSQNQTNVNGTNWGNTQQPDYFSDQHITDNSEEAKAARARGLQNMQDQQNQQFDSSKLTNPNAQITVKAWNAAQTWLPDYLDDSDARQQEIINNLNAYWNTNKSIFSNRETFNKNFEYDKRSDRQKALLDSFWKGKQDEATAAKYTTANSITQWMNNAEITPEIMDLLKQNNPEAYAQWQKAMEDDINKRIANLTTPWDETNITNLFNKIVKDLNLEAWDPYKIYDNWYSMCEQLGVFRDSDRLKEYQWQIDANHKAIENITKKYASSAWWAQSAALSSARMQKALAPYMQIESDLQNAYTTLLNWRNSNLAVANQSANALNMQAQEDQRIFNQKLSWLGFAVTTYTTRTQEQQFQNQLQFQAISNDLNLLNTSKANDLNLYNQYATQQLKNKMAAEMTDLNTTDENQLRTNLNNILTQYYSSYWDIIQRSQPQAIDDILKYAKENNVSVAEALTKNFIEPLQAKDEYKQKIAKNYWMISTQQLGSINWENVIITNNPDWSIDIKYFWNTQNNNLSKWLANFVIDHPIDSKWWQCWSFVNDYLEDLWLGRMFWNEYSQKQSMKNTDVATVWSIAIMPSSKYPNNWHVAIVTGINNEKWTVTVVESNWWWDEQVHSREVKMSDIYWYYAPSIDWWWTAYISWYNSSRVPAYEKYLKDWTYPTDAKLKSMWNWDIQKWMQIFESEVQSYSNEKWVEYYSPEARKEITDLRKEFNNRDDVKEFRDVENSYNKILSAADWTAAWDVSMIFAYMKMLDPGSVVREWEFATAQNAWSVSDKIYNLYNQALNWTRLTQKQRNNFLDVAKSIYVWYAEKYNKILAEYQTYVNEWGDASQIWQYVQLPWKYKTTSLQDLSTWWSINKQGTIDSLVNRWKNNPYWV